MESSRRSGDDGDDGGREGKYEKLTPAQEMRKQREFSNLSNVFADIFSGAQAGEVIFKGQFNGAKAKVITGGGSQGSQGETGAAGEEQGEAAAEEEDRDLVLARALQAIEDDAYRTMKRMEEEDERYARELARSENGAADVSTPAGGSEATERPTSGRRRLLISSSEGDDSAAATTGKKGWRELVRQDSLTERDRLLALQLLEEEDREKRKRETEDEALAKSLSTGEPTGKRRRTDEAAAEMTSDELIVRLLQEEEEETHRRERAKKAKEEEAMSRKLIEKLMRAEEMDHDEWVRSELAQIDERESKAAMTTKKKKKAWPGFGFGWGDKERMREKAEGKIVGDSDWKSTRFFADTSVLEGFLFSCAKQNGTRACASSLAVSSVSSPHTTRAARATGSVTITNVMKYDLVEKFDRKWSEFKAAYGSTAAESQTTLAFHGTHTQVFTWA